MVGTVTRFKVGKCISQAGNMCSATMYPGNTCASNLVLDWLDMEISNMIGYREVDYQHFFPFYKSLEDFGKEYKENF